MPAVQIVALGLFRIINVPVLLKKSWGLISLQKSLKALLLGFFCFFMIEHSCETVNQTDAFQEEPLEIPPDTIKAIACELSIFSGFTDSFGKSKTLPAKLYD